MRDCVPNVIHPCFSNKLHAYKNTQDILQIHFFLFILFVSTQRTPKSQTRQVLCGDGECGRAGRLTRTPPVHLSLPLERSVPSKCVDFRLGSGRTGTACPAVTVWPTRGRRTGLFYYWYDAVAIARHPDSVKRFRIRSLVPLAL